MRNTWVLSSKMTTEIHFAHIFSLRLVACVYRGERQSDGWIDKERQLGHKEISHFVNLSERLLLLRKLLVRCESLNVCLWMWLCVCGPGKSYYVGISFYFVCPHEVVFLVLRQPPPSIMFWAIYLQALMETPHKTWKPNLILIHKHTSGFKSHFDSVCSSKSSESLEDISVIKSFLCTYHILSQIIQGTF